MKLKNSFLAYFLVAAGVAANTLATCVKLTEMVAEEQAVVATIPPSIYVSTSRKPGSLESELRVVDSSSNNVPYAIRPSEVRCVKVVPDWRGLSLVSVVDTNGVLTVEAQWPEGEEAPDRFMDLKIDTPLDDFEMQVTVYCDGKELAAGRIFDKHKFADVRADTIRLNSGFCRRLKVVFSSPVSQIAANDYEKIDTQSKSGDAVQSTRRRFSDRAFRVNSLQVSLPRDEISFRPAENVFVPVEVQPWYDAKSKKTTFTFDVAYLPVCGFMLDVINRNFIRTVRLQKHAGGAWQTIGVKQLGSVSIPTERHKGPSIRFDLGSEVREGVFRIEVDDKDNPPLTYAKQPIRLAVRPYDAVFVAEPGKLYSLSVEKGASAPQYDAQLLDYLRGMRNLRRLRAAKHEAAIALSAVDAGDIGIDIVPVATVLSFVVLGLLAFYMLKSGAKKDDGTC